MKALLIDDEQESHDVLSFLLKSQHPKIHIQDSAFSVQEGIQLIERHQPDLLFLDIEMPDGTGFDLLKQYPNPTFKVIFVTAFNQYAQTAIHLGALDYLTKPVDTKELETAILKAKVQHLEGRMEQLEVMQQAIMSLQQHQVPKRMSISTLEGLFFFATEDIIRLEAAGKYTRFFVQNDDRVLIASFNIKTFEKDFASFPQFMRVHRSHIIHLDKVTRVMKGNDFCAEMVDGECVPVSRRYRESLLERMNP